MVRFRARSSARWIAVAVLATVSGRVLLAQTASMAPDSASVQAIQSGNAPAANPHVLRQSLVSKELHHDISPALRTLKPVVKPTVHVAAGNEEGAENRETHASKPAAAIHAADPVAQTSAAIASAATAGLNFDGVTAPAGRVVPDTNGAVGSTQYFQWVNTSFEIFNKSTGASIYGPFDASTLWTGFSPCNTTDDDDVVVEYDRMANVWVLEQHVAPASGSNYQCIAVSKTSDATGSYYRYVFSLPSNFPDYPKISVWPDAYYLTMNEETEGTYKGLGAYVCALDRANMLLGNPATSQCFQLSSSYQSLLPADLNGSILPPAGSPNYLINLAVNSLNLWQFHVDWVTPANSTLTGPLNIPVASYGLACKASSLCAPQAGTTQLVDGLGGYPMFRLIYRHFADGHESLVATHSVNTPAAVRWYEIQSPGSNPYIFQQGTFAPDSNYRWLGSIGMDQMGDIAVGYSVSSASMNPAIRYTGRLQSDPLNTMEAETSVIEGTGSEVGSNRWGDYSSMSLDPVDDCTFWYTNEYFPTSGDFNWHTRVASFSYPSCTSNPPVTLAPFGLYFGSEAIGSSTTAQTVILTNQQTVPLHISEVTPSGPYTETDNCVSGSPIAAGGTCTINIVFTPTASGTQTGQVVISDDAPNATQVVNLTGIGSAPSVTLAPTSLKFNTLTGSSSLAQAVKLTNSGIGALTISSITTSGDYSETDNCVSSSPLAGGASCTINVTFAPTATGSLNGVLTVYDNGINGAPHRVPLTGSGLVTVGVSPSTLAFPSTTVGNTSSAQTVTVTNNASAAQNIGWSVGGDFAAVASGTAPCGSVLAAAASCTLSVTFSPTTNGTGGTVRGALAVSDTSGSVLFNPQSVTLSGLATGGPATNPLAFSPTSLNFGNVAIGETYTGNAVIQNSTAGSLTLSSVTGSGDFSVGPSASAPCVAGLVLKSKAKCGIKVSLTPTGGGSVQGSITFVDNASSGAKVQTYNLASVAHWPITLTPATLTFPATALGATSSPLQVTVTNYSTLSVTLYNFLASGDYAAVALGTNQCSPATVLSPGASCTFGITFTPTVSGTIAGAATLVHSAPYGPQVLPLSGTGQ